MGLVELFLLAVGLSMDAFAVAVCAGLTMDKLTIKKIFTVGLYFGVFQAGMPLIGYLLAMQFADHVVAYSPWIAFALLTFLGGKLIAGALKKNTPSDGEPDGQCGCIETSLGPKKMLPLAVATSIDALAVGVSLAFLNVNILSAVSLIGVVTLVMSMIGVKVGNLFGTRFKSKAEILGGVILVGIGVHILFEHMLAAG